MRMFWPRKELQVNETVSTFKAFFSLVYSELYRNDMGF